MADDPRDYDDDGPYDEDDDEGLDDCGMTADGTCTLAGTEWCDWCCPLGAAATLRRNRRPRITPPADSGEG